MSEQPNLFQVDPAELPPIVEAVLPSGATHAERAAEFHRLNPHVMRLVIRLGLWAKAKGIPHYGIGAIWEILRFKAIETIGDAYKLNNNFRAWYAREAMRSEPRLSDYFECRASPHDADYYTKQEIAGMDR